MAMTPEEHDYYSRLVTRLENRVSELISERDDLTLMVRNYDATFKNFRRVIGECADALGMTIIPSADLLRLEALRAKGAHEAR